jgi:hypothetical protein
MDARELPARPNVESYTEEATDRGANLELALAWATVHGRTDTVEVLTQIGVDPRKRNQWGRLLA